MANVFTEEMTRYTSAYPRRESPLENLQMIRDEGIGAYLERQREK